MTDMLDAGPERPRALAARYYTDPDILALELERVFARTWQLVGHTSMVAEPGMLFTAQVGDESVIVANDAGTVRAFYNVCQHRGHELILPDPQGPEGAGVATRKVRSISCPYHAWAYDLGGRLRAARGQKVGELCVPPVRLETMAGFLYANLDADAPPMSEVLPGVEQELLAIAPDAADRVLSARRTHLINANWKVTVENYNECYHCPNVHKAFSAGVVSPASYRVTPRGECIHHTADAPTGPDAAYAQAEDGNDYGSFFTWPVSSIQCYPGRVLNTFRWVPLAVDRTLLIREWWFHAEELTPDQEALVELDWTTTVAEDFDLMDSVQRGMGSRGYRPGPLITSADGVATVHSEDTVPHLHGLLLAALGH